MAMVVNAAHLVENVTFADIKRLRDRALVLVGSNTPHSLHDIAALRWSDLHIQDTSVTIHWRHPYNMPRDECLPGFVSAVLLDYLHALHGPELASLEPDTPLWIGLRRVSDRLMLSTRSIAEIYRKHVSKKEN